MARSCSIAKGLYTSTKMLLPNIVQQQIHLLISQLYNLFIFNGILNCTQILKRDKILNSFVGYLIKVVSILLILINDVLDLAKIEADRIENE